MYHESSTGRTSADNADLSPAELSDYLAWATETSPSRDEPYSKDLQLDTLALRQRAVLDGEMRVLQLRLSSELVLRAGHYNPGGGNEIVQELRRIQAESLPQIYAQVRLETLHTAWHTPQETPTWCQLASVSNAVTALGHDPISQTEIAAAKSIARDGRPFPDDMRALLADRSLQTQDIESVTGLMDSLIAGDKAIINLGYPSYPLQHAMLVSGVRIDHGDIEFLVNDPSVDYMQPLPLGRMLELLEPPLEHNILNRSYTISDVAQSNMA